MPVSKSEASKLKTENFLSDKLDTRMYTSANFCFTDTIIKLNRNTQDLCYLVKPYTF